MLLTFEDLEMPSQSLGVSLQRGKIVLTRSVVSAVSDEPIADCYTCREKAAGPSDNRERIHYSNEQLSRHYMDKTDVNIQISSMKPSLRS